MNNDINDKTILWAILLISLMLNVYLLTREDKIIEKEVVEYVERKDTVVVFKHETDTLYLEKLITKNVVDTIHTNDTTTLYNYSDSVIDIKMQAQRLDWLKYNVHHKDTITLYETKYIEKTVKDNKKPLITHGIQVGAGYGFINRKPDVYVGYGFQINF